MREIRIEYENAPETFGTRVYFADTGEEIHRICNIDLRIPVNGEIEAAVTTLCYRNGRYVVNAQGVLKQTTRYHVASMIIGKKSI